METNLTALRLYQCRREAKETLEQIGALVGVNKSTVLRWERGDTSKINLPTLHRLAEHYRVNPLWLMGTSDNREAIGLSTPGFIPLPVMGTVRAGMGGVVLDDPSGTEPVDATSLQDGYDYFWLRVSGDSMTPIINDRDLVLVRRQDKVDSGRYAVVIVDGEEGLVKRVVYAEDWLELQSVNPYYPPRRFEGEQLAAVTVVGLVVESKRKYI